MIIAVGFKVNSERAAAEKPHMGLTTYFNKTRLPRCHQRRRGALVFASINFETELKNHGNVVLQMGDELHQLWRCNRYKIFCIGLRSFVGIVIQFVGEFQYRIGTCFQFTKRSRESKRIFIILSWKLYNTRCVFGWNRFALRKAWNCGNIRKVYTIKQIIRAVPVVNFSNSVITPFIKL